MTNDQRNHVVQRLLILSDKNYKLPHGAMKQVAEEMGCYRVTANSYWRKAKKSLQECGRVNVCSKKPRNVGRKAKFIDEDAIRSIPPQCRTTLRRFASALDVSPSYIVSLLKKGIIRSHTNSIRPSVNHSHKIARLRWILGLIIPGSPRQLIRFECLINLVHIDEKWFFLSKITQRYYLPQGEEKPLRATQNKNFIPECMFLAAIARPQFGVNGECIFDGKIGIWPFTEIHVAKRSSANRPAGSVEERALHSITRPVIRQIILENLIPAIKAKWPINAATKCILIQQDNVRPHIHTNDQEFMVVANTDGLEMPLICQPAQSPDLNVLDLGFFRAIQALQQEKFPNNTEELIKAVKDALEEYEPKKIHFTWLQLQYVMLEIMKDKGGNNYKNPHKGKCKLEAIGQLPFQVNVPSNLLEQSIALLDNDVIDSRGKEPDPDEIEGYEVFD